MLFGYGDDSEVLGKPLSSLIPSLDLPRPSLEDQVFYIHVVYMYMYM